MFIGFIIKGSDYDFCSCFKYLICFFLQTVIFKRSKNIWWKQMKSRRKLSMSGWSQYTHVFVLSVSERELSWVTYFIFYLTQGNCSKAGASKSDPPLPFKGRNCRTLNKHVLSTFVMKLGRLEHLQFENISRINGYLNASQRKMR